jgi:hypothetical protein
MKEECDGSKKYVHTFKERRVDMKIYSNVPTFRAVAKPLLLTTRLVAIIWDHEIIWVAVLTLALQ